MKFKRIHIKHIMGVDDCEYTPGEVLTVFEGSNDTGKTSHLRALLSLLGGPPPAIANDADRGEILFEIDNGDTLRKVLARGQKPRLLIKDAKGKRIPIAPQEYVDKLLNAIEFADEKTPAKQRLAMLLKVAPVTVSEKELAVAVGQRMNVELLAKELTEASNALPILDRLRQQLYDDRTDANREHKSKTAHVEELRATLPAGETASVAEELEGVQAEARSLAVERQGRMEEASEACAQATEEARVEAEKAIKAIEHVRRVEEADAHEARAQAERAIDRDLGDRAQELAAEQARLEELARQHERADQTREHVRFSEGAIADLKAASEELTTCIEGIDDLKKAKLAKFPIRGLEIRGDDIWINVPKRGVVIFEDLNTAKRIGVALRVAAMAAGECGAICIDGIERLDRARTEAFQKGAKKSGLQFFATRVVPEGELKIRTVGAGEQTEKGAA